MGKECRLSQPEGGGSIWNWGKRWGVREDFPLYKYQSSLLLESTWFLMSHFTMSLLHQYLFLPG